MKYVRNDEQNEIEELRELAQSVDIESESLSKQQLIIAIRQQQQRAA